MEMIDIGQLAAQSGVPASTLRYYDEIGLISSVTRHGLRRQFGPEAIWRLRLIALGKRAGFSLSEIADVVGAGGVTDLPRPVLKARVAEIDKQIEELQVLRDTIQHVAECTAPSHLECPRFQKLLRIATRQKSGEG